MGSHSLHAVYTGSTFDYTSTSSAYTQVVQQDKVSVVINSSANPAAFGTDITFTANVATSAPGTGTPTGTVTFYDGAAPIGTGVLTAGLATFSTSSLAVGSHSITAVYSGDIDDAGSSTNTPITQVITGTTSPTVAGVVINPGEGAAGSRTYLGNSRVLSIQVTFSSPVDNTAALKRAFSLTRTGLPNGLPGDGAAIGDINVTLSSSGTLATLTFSGANTEGGSLGDGIWTLGINAADVASGGTPMASNYTQAEILRLYGDFNGTGTVDSTDLGAFGTTFGLVSSNSAFLPAFDSDGNGEIDSIDLGRFGTNFGLSI